MKRISWIAPGAPPDAFPDVATALDDPPGLLAGGGDLSLPRLLAAYSRGIFPWFLEGQPVLWWSPDPREVLFPARMHRSRSLRRRIARGQYLVTENQAFAAIVAACADTRATGGGTWITPDMRAAYQTLHAAGHAHSIEVWCDGALAGGLYGVRSGRVFSGESMFSLRDDASKVALEWLARHGPERGIELIDCQMPSAHLRSLGSQPLPRPEFLAFL